MAAENSCYNYSMPGRKNISERRRDIISMIRKAILLCINNLTRFELESRCKTFGVIDKGMS